MLWHDKFSLLFPLNGSTIFQYEMYSHFLYQLRLSFNQYSFWNILALFSKNISFQVTSSLYKRDFSRIYTFWAPTIFRYFRFIFFFFLPFLSFFCFSVINWQGQQLVLQAQLSLFELFFLSLGSLFLYEFLSHIHRIKF